MYKPIRMKPPSQPQTGASKLKNTLTRRRLCYDEHLEKEKLRAELMSKLSECQSLNKMLTEQINSSTRPKRMPKNTLKSKSIARKQSTITNPPPPPPPQTSKERQLYTDVIEEEFKKQLPRTRSGRAAPPRPRIQGIPIHQVIKQNIINDIGKKKPFRLKDDIINAIEKLDSDADIKGTKDILAERLKNLIREKPLQEIKGKLNI